MADLSEALVFLAGRGRTVGSQGMIDRIDQLSAGRDEVVIDSSLPRAQRRRIGSAGWAVAVFVGVVGVVGLLWAVSVSRPYFDAAGSPEPGPEAVFAERVAKIDGLKAAMNAGDLAEFKTFFSEEPNLFGGLQFSDLQWEPYRAFMAAHETWEITGACTRRGRSLIACPISVENDFFTPSGIRSETSQLLASFDRDGAIRTFRIQPWAPSGSLDEYTTAFDIWLQEAHPDIYRSFGPRVGDLVAGWGDLPAAPDMPVAVGLVEEFMAESDVYPLTP